MEHAILKGQVISASKFLEKDYITEKEIRQASRNKQILCIDPLCHNKVLKYCHGEIREPYFAHVEGGECDYADYDKTRSEEIAQATSIVYTVLRDRGFCVEREIKLLEHHYSHITVNIDGVITAIEFINKNLNVRTTDKLKAYEENGYRVSWIELGSVESIVDEKHTYYARRFALNEYARTLVTIDKDRNRIMECRVDDNDYTYKSCQLMNKEMYLLEGSVNNLTFENGIVGLEWFDSAFDEWQKMRKEEFFSKCKMMDETNERREQEREEQRIILEQQRKKNEEIFQREAEEAKVKKGNKVEEQKKQFELEKDSLRGQIAATNNTVRDSVGKQVFECKCCNSIGYSNIFYTFAKNGEKNKGVCKQCHDEERDLAVNTNIVKKAVNICPKCCGEIVVRRSQFGTFYGCSNFPFCKYNRKSEG